MLADRPSDKPSDLTLAEQLQVRITSDTLHKASKEQVIEYALSLLEYHYRAKAAWIKTIQTTWDGTKVQ